MQETIEDTHAQETPAYQHRPTTLHEGQGSNPPIRALYMQLAKIPHTHQTTPRATQGYRHMHTAPPRQGATQRKIKLYVLFVCNFILQPSFSHHTEDQIQYREIPKCPNQYCATRSKQCAQFITSLSLNHGKVFG